MKVLERHTVGAAALVRYDRLDYDKARALQKRFVDERCKGQRSDTLLLLEHGPVFTVGRSGREEHWGGEAALRATGVPVHHVERGGSITYHGPGQLVAYPILKLTNFCAGPKAYVRKLEEVLIGTLATWGIEGNRLDKFPGVWVSHNAPAKIAAVGVRIERGITMHGIALNVAMDLAPFERIIPCGIAGCRVTSMEKVIGHPLDIAAVHTRFVDEFARVFGVSWTEGT
ncbi:MAG: lipoyl(octanoyl) transferase LipB [Nitrospira sp.]|nr:lipoyl(octanoyl) transferase LipB [Nitrospira sp.]